MEGNQCLFRNALQHWCKPKAKLYKNALSQSECKLEKVRACSVQRKDDLHKNLSNNSGYYHGNCYATYTSAVHIDRYKKRKEQETDQTEKTEITEQTPKKKNQVVFLTVF